MMTLVIGGAVVIRSNSFHCPFGGWICGVWFETDLVLGVLSLLLKVGHPILDTRIFVCPFVNWLVLCHAQGSPPLKSLTDGLESSGQIAFSNLEDSIFWQKKINIYIFFKIFQDLFSQDSAWLESSDQIA